MGGNSQEWQRDVVEVVGLLEGSENGDSDKSRMQIFTRICLRTLEINVFSLFLHQSEQFHSNFFSDLYQTHKVQ